MKTNKNSTRKKPRNRCITEFYRNFYTLKQNPISELFFENLAKDFTAWAQKSKKSIVIREFALEKGIPWRTFMHWCSENEIIKSVYGEVKAMISDRRESGMAYGILKEKSVMYKMHRYSDEWKEDNEYWSKLNERVKPGDTNGPITIELVDHSKGKD